MASPFDNRPPGLTRGQMASGTIPISVTDFDASGTIDVPDNSINVAAIDGLDALSVVDGEDTAPVLQGLSAAGAATYTTRLIRYSYIAGSTIEITGRVTLSAKTSVSGAVEITWDAPAGVFPDPRYGRSPLQVSVAQVNTVSTVTQRVVGYIEPAAGSDIWSIKLYREVDDGDPVALTDSDLEDTSDFLIQGVVPIKTHAGLLALYASTAQTIVDVAGGASSVTLNGSDVSAVENLGTGADFTQATPSAQPAYSATGFGAGKPGLLGDGASWLAHADAAEASTTQKTLIALATIAAGASGQYVGAHYLSTGNQRAWALIATANEAVQFLIDDTGSSAQSSTGANDSWLGTHVVEMLWNADDPTIVIDGVEITPTVSGTTKTSLFDSTADYTIMAASGGVTPMLTGSVFGALIDYPGVLPATDRAVLRAAFSQAGGI